VANDLCKKRELAETKQYITKCQLMKSTSF
jgi:hypothetical protein